MPTQSWITPSAASKYGGAFITPAPATKDSVAAATVAGPAPGRGTASLLHPDPPMLWIGAILAAAVGLAAVSTTVRVGPAKVAASLGK